MSAPLVMHNENYHEQVQNLYGWIGNGICSLVSRWQIESRRGLTTTGQLVRHNEVCLVPGWETDEQLVELLKGWEPYTSSDTGSLPELNGQAPPSST